MKLIEKLTEDILDDSYFSELFDKSLIQTAESIFKIENRSNLSKKELRDSLRFADILSNSKNSEARNKSYQIVSALNYKYNQSEVYKTVSKAVFSKLGNFPAINYLESKNQNTSTLPFLRSIEADAKKIIQAAPHGKGIIFTDTQFNLYRKLSNSLEFSFSGPTSMGKSFIIKSFIKRVIKNSPPENIVIIVPTRALINQFFIDLKEDLEELLELYDYKIFINSNVTNLITDRKFNYIFVLTPERLISYLSEEDNPPIGFLFIDEAHKLANEKDSRSITIYTAIEKVQKKYGKIKLYFSSPNVSNPEVFLKLFGRDISMIFKTDESPVSQNLYFVDLINNSVEAYTKNRSIKLPQILPENDNISLEEFIQHIGEEKNNLIYCYSKKNTINKAIDLYGVVQKKEVSESIQKAIANIKEYIHPDYYLVKFLEKGIAYHYGKLPQLIRNLVEELYQQEEIRYVFCTSTLLEGVNMPTQNIFVIDGRSGSRTPLSQIDFWNLSGRAGRLNKELSGNIFCIENQDYKWENKDVFIKKEVTLKPTVTTKIDRNIQRIEKAIKDGVVKSGTNTEKEILKYIANIIKVDTLETKSNYQSPIINQLIENNKNKIIELAKSKVDEYRLPTSLLKYNQTIDFNIQERVYRKVKEEKISILPKPDNINYKSCLQVLNHFHDLYSWDLNEKKLSNKNSLKYYAVLMNQWINGFSLSKIIKQSIDYKVSKGEQIRVNYTEFEDFDRKNVSHINILIEDLIDNIEDILRYKLEKYFNHYYQVLCNVLGEENAGENWASLMEYGSQNPFIIALQNIGISRNTAIKIYKYHKDSLIIEDKKLVGIKKEELLKGFNKDSFEFKEIRKAI